MFINKNIDVTQVLGSWLTAADGSVFLPELFELY